MRVWPLTGTVLRQIALRLRRQNRAQKYKQEKGERSCTLPHHSFWPSFFMHYAQNRQPRTECRLLQDRLRAQRYRRPHNLYPAMLSY